MADIRTIALPVADLEYNSNDEAQTRKNYRTSYRRYKC